MGLSPPIQYQSDKHASHKCGHLYRHKIKVVQDRKETRFQLLFPRQQKIIWSLPMTPIMLANNTGRDYNKTHTSFKNMSLSYNYYLEYLWKSNIVL